MITTVTINPAVDKTYIVEELKPGALNRAKRTLYNAGSKGINVSRVLRILGEETCVLGFVGGPNGDILLKELQGEGISEDMIRVKGDTRLNIKVMSEGTRTVTEINEPGQMVSEKELAAFLECYDAHLKTSDAIVLSGSTLPGMPDHIYGQLVREAKAAGKVVFLDCGGAQLTEGCKASPDYIKPNEFEFAQMLGKTELSQEEMIAAAKDLIAKYKIGCVVITLGKEGAIGVTARECYKVFPPQVEVVSTVGAGDAFLSGLCHAHSRGFDFKAQLITATSFSNAKITKEGTVMPSLIELIGYTEGCRIVNLEG